jgi:hypothetical protein
MKNVRLKSPMKIYTGDISIHVFEDKIHQFLSCKKGLKVQQYPQVYTSM